MDLLPILRRIPPLRTLSQKSDLMNKEPKNSLIVNRREIPSALTYSFTFYHHYSTVA